MIVKNWNSLAFLERLFPWYDGTSFGNCFEKSEWDSAYWGLPFYRINGPGDKDDLKDILSLKDPFYCFSEVPAEEYANLRKLQDAGFRLVETRLTYFHLLDHLPAPGRQTRLAGKEDVPYLRETASLAVNPFDKYHADPFFSESEAGQYLATYIENCVKGFAERVFVPDLNEPPFSFAALSRLILSGWTSALPIFRIPLTACLPANKGWHYDLCLAALHYARSKEAACLVMTTQATNKAVIHNCEKLGFKLGSCTLVVSTSNQT